MPRLAASGTALPRSLVETPRGEQRASRVEGRIVGAVQGAADVPALDEKVCFVKRRLGPRDAVASQRVGGIHNGMLSRATFLMNGVSRHTGWFRIPGVTTRGEM
jgi:hypothetical protein